MFPSLTCRLFRVIKVLPRLPVRHTCSANISLVNSTFCTVIKPKCFNRFTKSYFRQFWTSKGCLSGKSVSFLLSDIGEGINEVIIKEWFVSVGDKVNQFDSICEVQSDKASVTITSRYDGIIEKIHYEIDQTAKVGEPLVDIRISTGESQLAERKASEQIVEFKSSHEEPARDIDLVWKSDKVLTTPAVRRLAAEHKICLSDIIGSGKDGRIMKEDVFKFLEEMSEIRRSAVQDFPPKNLSLNDQKAIADPPRSEISVPFTTIQRAMFKSMDRALKIPHFGLCDEIDLTKLVQILPELRAKTSDLGIKLTFMPFFMKALSITLQKYPIMNSVVNEEEEKVVQKMYHNIGFALDTKQGLYVPNVKDVQTKSIIEIARELKRLQEAGAKGSIGPGDLSGGTITLSNIGSIGGQFGIPIIFPPEVVIAAIGQTKAVPRFDDQGAIVKAHISNVLWSADHRIIDGATMCRFSGDWKSLIEQPTYLLLSLK